MRGFPFLPISCPYGTIRIILPFSDFARLDFSNMKQRPIFPVFLFFAVLITAGSKNAVADYDYLLDTAQQAVTDYRANAESLAKWCDEKGLTR